jgi:hypothetical protein
MVALRHLRDALVRAATSRETLAAFLVALTVWGLARVDVLPAEATVLLVPALAPAMLLDAFAHNELGVRAGATFSVLLVGFAYVEAVFVGAAVRAVATGRGGEARPDSPESRER